MGARGPLRVVRGSGLAAVGGSAAAEVQPRMPKKPKNVAADAELSQWWDDIVPGLFEAGLTSAADTAAIVSMLQHLCLSHKAYKTVVQEGISIMVNEEKPEHGWKKNPQEAVMRLESAAFLEYAKQLGMTWMSRARTAIPKGDSDSGNPFGSEATSG